MDKADVLKEVKEMLKTLEFIMFFLFGFYIAPIVLNFLIRDNIYPYFIFFSIATIIYLTYILWWEHWGQYMFHRIIIRKKKE